MEGDMGEMFRRMCEDALDPEFQRRVLEVTDEDSDNK
ncbi:hypothetical protein SEA_POKYPUPPY_65 [Gordonia phage PokyPuppy]|nr:hypothetical protein SEA_POKYPUPPY_65 [Gordonia phage PokyPuppy]